MTEKIFLVQICIVYPNYQGTVTNTIFMKSFCFNLAKQKIKCQEKRMISNQIFINFLQQNLKNFAVEIVRLIHNLSLEPGVTNQTTLKFDCKRNQWNPME